jgi:hypothetical protein
MLRRLAPILALAATLFTASCATFDPKHPLAGKPKIVAAQAGYWIWVDDGQWHLRMTAGGKKRRFQGSMAGVNGSVAELTTTGTDLKDRIALQGNAVLIDLELGPGGEPEGFDARVVGGCARFDVLIDGQYRPEQVRLGPRVQPARRVPFEKCP